MAAGVRVRRAPSPSSSLPHAAPHSQRFPNPRHDHLDADERRAAASRGYGPGRKSHPSGGINMTSAEWKLLGVVVIIALGVRLFRLSRPNSIVFDEVHFGKFASKYIKSSYFVDVHPPLAKLLITLAGFIFGYDGNFDFKDIAKVYEGNVPYVAMRLVPALLGVATVPLAYVTLRALDCRATTALLASLFITFENGLITQSRHILLDSPLIFFTALTTFLWTGFCNEDKQQPFTESWWVWLALTGLSLGATVSCKWVGLFTIATIGLGTLKQLWTLLGDVRVSARLWTRHFVARAICLILVPITFYMFMFWIHFLILSNSGDGDGFMSSEFQHTLRGRGMSDTYLDVGYGSVLNIRHVNTQGGYLHSHSHTYPTGSQQQQVTLYPHRDSNNEWRVVNATATPDPYTAWTFQPFEYVRTGDRIKLRHISTDHSLHSHDYRPPVSDVDFQQEVSAYGMTGFVGDANDDWIVEIHKGDKRDVESWKRLKTLKTQFRLRHVMSGCYLFSHKVKLPDWGFEQQEVTCNKNAVLANSLWYIETASHPNMPPNAPTVNYKRPGFIAKFLELQQVMWTTNAGLTERHAFDSRPDAWPRLRRGINFWVKDNRQIYLLGNPLVWWLSTAAVLFYAAIRGLLIIRAKRGYKDFENTKVVKYDTLCGFLFVGWGLHYFPFYLMGRQLFLHHYFPALYFAILLCCAVFDLVTSALRPRVRLQIAALLVILAIWNYAYLSPLAYGLPWTKQKCKNAQWLKHWDFSCNDFHDSYAQYNVDIAPTPVKTPTPVVAPIVGEPAAVKEEKIEIGVELPSAEADAESTTTSIPFGQAEPAHDIFAANEVNKPNSDTIPVAQREPEAPREAAKDVSTDEQLTTDSVEASLADSTLVESGTSAGNGQETVAAAVDPTGTSKDTSKVPDGDAEAESVRKELFPDEAGSR